MGNKLKIQSIGFDRLDEWNSLVRGSEKFSLMQSSDWGDFKSSQGWDVVRLGILDGDKLISGAQILFLPIFGGFYSLAYLPRGPICQPRNLEALEKLMKGIEIIAYQRRAIYIKVEPQWEHTEENSQLLYKFGYRESKHTNQPRASLILDLTLTDDELLLQMSKSTRRNIRYSKRHGVIVNEGSRKDLKRFYELLKVTAARKKFPIRGFDYYENEWKIFASNGDVRLLFASYQDKDLATRMVFTCGPHAAQFHSAISGEFPRLKANHLLVWESIKWAQFKGCVSYDFWGIPDEVGEMHYTGNFRDVQRKDGLWGVYQFKKGFGGKVVFYVGAFDYVLSKFIYSISVNGILRNFSIDQIIKRYPKWNFRNLLR